MSSLDKVTATFATSQMAIDMAQMIDAAQGQVDSLNAQLTQVQSDLAAAKDSLVAMTNAKDAAAAQIVVLSNQIAGLNSEIATLQAQLAAATPPAPPAPPPPPPPKGNAMLMTRPSMIEAMTEISPDVWRSDDLAGLKKAVLQFHLSSPVPRGATLRVFANVASNVVLDNSRNLKFRDRNWFGQIGGAEVLNNAFCTQKAGNPIFSTEHLQLVSIKYDPVTHQPLPWNRAYIGWPKYSDTPRPETSEYRFPSAPGKADGAVKFSTGGVVIFAADKWQADDASHPGTRDIICLQMVYAPISGDAGPLPANAYYEIHNPRVEVILP